MIYNYNLYKYNIIHVVLFCWIKRKIPIVSRFKHFKSKNYKYILLQMFRRKRSKDPETR